MSHSKNLLGAVGKEDGYLTYNAKNTFFKKSFKTHSYFGSNWTIIGNNDKPSSSSSSVSFAATKFPSKSSIYFRIPFQADMLLNTLLRFKVFDNDAGILSVAPAKTHDNELNTSTEEGIGEFTALSLISKIELTYNDKVISSLDKNFIANYMKLTLSSEQYINYRKITSYDSNSTIFDSNMPEAATSSDRDAGIGKFVRFVTLPLPFWFTLSEGQAFPMWALKNPNLGMKVTLSDYTDHYGTNNCNIFNIELLAHYAYLESEEKKKFRTQPLEYVIEQVDIIDKITISENQSFTKKIPLPKSHFVKYLIWNLTENGTLGYSSNGSKFEFDSCDGIENLSISINGNEVISDMSGLITRQILRHMYFKTPKTNVKNMYDSTTKGNNDLNIHTYSFCLEPTSFQPSGFITTEKFNNVTLTIKGQTPTASHAPNKFDLNIYAIKHNIIRISNGYIDILFN